MYDYKIVTKPQFTLVGYSRRFNSQTSYEEIPRFWAEHYSSKIASIVKGKDVCGEYAVCYDCEKNGEFKYMIADNYVATDEIPAGAELKVVSAHTWAVFPCKGALPKALQDVNTYIFNDWLPNSKQYRMSGDLSMEAYFPGVPNHPEHDYSEIWIPIEEK